MSKLAAIFEDISLMQTHTESLMQEALNFQEDDLCSHTCQKVLAIVTWRLSVDGPDGDLQNTITVSTVLVHYHTASAVGNQVIPWPLLRCKYLEHNLQS